MTGHDLTAREFKTVPGAPHALMCRPSWFEVSYSINTFMEGNCGRVDRELAMRQWEELYRAVVKAGASVELIEPEQQPDFVFTANAGLLWKGTVIPSRFLHGERQGEEVHYKRWFQERGYEMVEVPEDQSFEGEGDVVILEDLAFMGYGSRTSFEAGATVQQVTGLEVAPLGLDPRGFYHLDTCMVSLGSDRPVFYYPGAFKSLDLETIALRIPGSRRVEVSREEALCFACNMVVCGETAIFPAAPASFHEKVRSAGLRPVAVELSEFIKAGGAAKCLTLWLND